MLKKLLLFLLFLPSYCLSEQLISHEAIIVNQLPHSKQSFTQGLIVDGNHFIESTGLYGHSSLQRIELQSGQPIQHIALSPQVFAEGLTRVGEQIILLTWKAGKALVFDRSSLEFIKSIPYQHTSFRRDKTQQGWGLTDDGEHLILSDGSSWLHYLQPETLKPVRSIQVLMQGQPLERLNELEFVDGEIFANLWQRDFIVRINSDGKVTGRIDMKNVIQAAGRYGPENVLNGIAFDKKNQRLFVTGKRWPWIFEITLKEK